MGLPKLNEVPMYNVTIPSSGEKTRFRPYLVKEEKVLMVAMESRDELEIASATLDLILACIEADISRDDLTTFDMEYLFLQIRAKSVGETSKINLMCQNEDCEEMVEVQIQLDQIEVKGVDQNNKLIQITPNVKIEMKYPTYTDLVKNEYILKSKSKAEALFHTVISAFKAVHTEEERILFEEESYEEIVKFLDNFTTDQYAKLSSFIENSPSLEYTVDYTCKKCSSNNQVKLKGLQDFF